MTWDSRASRAWEEEKDLAKVTVKVAREVKEARSWWCSARQVNKLENEGVISYDKGWVVKKNESQGLIMGYDYMRILGNPDGSRFMD